VLHQLHVVDGSVPTDLVVGPGGLLLGLTQTGPGVGSGTVFTQSLAPALPSPTLLNASTRAEVVTGDQLLICGFIITDGYKNVLLRALGPSLSSAGINGALSDPFLELHQPDGTVVSNDNWKDSQEIEIEATGIPPTADKEAAIIANLAPGAYTAVMRGQDNGTGVAIVEAYDLDEGVLPKLTNTSARGFVGIDDNVMIDGIIIGSGNVRVLIRAIGPELTAQGVSDALQDTILNLYNQDGEVIASNDDWKESQQAEIEATGIPPTDDREAAILANLASGNYTAIMTGKDRTTGVALLELYNLGL